MRNQHTEGTSLLMASNGQRRKSRALKKRRKREKNQRKIAIGPVNLKSAWSILCSTTVLHYFDRRPQFWPQVWPHVLFCRPTTTQKWPYKGGFSFAESLH